MIQAVAPVSFKAATPQDALSRPGKYSMVPKEDLAPEKEKKNHKALKWIAGITVAALAVCGLLIAGNKQGWFTKLADDALENAGIMKKANHYLAVAGESLAKVWDKAVKFVKTDLPEKCKDLWAKIRGNKAENAASTAAATTGTTAGATAGAGTSVVA